MLFRDNFSFTIIPDHFSCYNVIILRVTYYINVRILMYANQKRSKHHVWFCMSRFNRTLNLVCNVGICVWKLIHIMLLINFHDMLSLLSTMDEINISVRSSRRIMGCTGLYRRKTESDTIDVASFLSDQPEGHQRLQWSKLHHLNCIEAGHVVAHKT